MALKLGDALLGLVPPSLGPLALPLVDWAVAAAANAALAANITIEVQTRMVGSFRNRRRPTARRSFDAEGSQQAAFPRR
jgi:hypothetical protein